MAVPTAKSRASIVATRRASVVATRRASVATRRASADTLENIPEQPEETGEPGSGGPSLPEPLNGATKVKEAILADVPSSGELGKWLKSNGLDTSTWGQGDTKDVSKYWKEIKLDEAGLEVWRKQDGEQQIVRVVHVLRAKVCSPENYDRGIFCFNTWQQYGDGRTRTRNGLLSEKLAISEMPLQEHLLEVCERAVCEEEMARVVESSCKITPGGIAPVFDANYKCPLEVVKVYFVDHTVEVEFSKSYPGLLTMYHLYTVDIVCTGLPLEDFNTLEFNHDGERTLKYIHAWVWLEWPRIQRYLFEGSELKERKSKGSFPNVMLLCEWLSQFDLDLSKWGEDSLKSVDDLYNELEREETQLELWGRHDGVPLLMRVVHVVQLKVTTPKVGKQKFLLQHWKQDHHGRVRTVNRLMSRKLRYQGNLGKESRLGEMALAQAAKDAVSEQLSYLQDAHFQLTPGKDLKVAELEASAMEILSAELVNHRYDLQDSQAFLGMNTMYHLYTIDVECSGLPTQPFTSVEFSRSRSEGGKPEAMVNGFKWITWMETMDILHAERQIYERDRGALHTGLEDASMTMNELQEVTARLSRRLNNAKDEDVLAVQKLSADLEEQLSALERREQGSSLAATLPPDMVSKMTENIAISEDLVDGISRAGTVLTRALSSKFPQ